jgi:hypothetical protein
MFKTKIITFLLRNPKVKFFLNFIKDEQVMLIESEGGDLQKLITG